MPRRSALLSVVFSATFVFGSLPAFAQAASPKAATSKAAVSKAAAAETRLEKKARLARELALAQKIGDLMADPAVARGFWGVHVVSLETGKTILELNPDKLFTPASNTKLFTTATALALLGPDFKTQTTVETTGTIDLHGRLSGDIILVGRGDPNLSGRVLPYAMRTERKTPHLKVLEELADQVVAKGVKVVDGDIVGDDSFFSFERFPEGWASDDLMWEYGAPVSALTVNDNVLFLNVLPGSSVGDKAFLRMDPDSTFYELDNRITTTAAASGPRKISIDRQPGSRTITLWGTIPLDDTGDSEALAIEDPAEFAAQAFRGMLQQRGVVVRGKQRAFHVPLANMPAVVGEVAGGNGQPSRALGGGAEAIAAKPSLPARQVLAKRDSAPLSDDVRVINKISQNLHAEIALRMVGQQKGKASTLEASLEAMKALLSQAGIQPEEYNFSDGSGLSRQNLITPRAVTKLLLFADSQPWGSIYRDTLPVAGVDGSLSERMKATVAQGRVSAKTGTLGNVNALGGYITTLRGERLAFSVFSNHHKLTSRGAVKVIDKIIEAIADDGRPATR
ncbi:MAG TPA: D-alanyl-D-alanine carboxypeptidase/D-alanyl-D-alanine-endopeptidase [Terriglobales bacterium]|nr:D-alanyl-D-alanine carboxypeptidase/D-alanyl-D-alanine-endopeptidase [Terriglobales bacterium]